MDGNLFGLAGEDSGEFGAQFAGIASDQNVRPQGNRDRAANDVKDVLILLLVLNGTAEQVAEKLRRPQPATEGALITPHLRYA
jgi:hypothetical protein